MRRTTVTLDADVEALLRKAMRERGISFEQALDEAVRNGLARGAPSKRRYRLETYRMGFRPGWGRPLAPDQAFDIVESWLEQPCVTCSCDADLARLPGVRRVNPIAP